MPEITDRLTHPVLGELGWLPEYSHWFGQLTLASGARLDLVVDPCDGDRFEFLTRAAWLFEWAVAHEREVLATAVSSYLLDLYNGVWQQDDLPVFDTDGFTAQLKWEFLKVSASDLVPVDYGYNPGDLFAGHSVAVEVGPELRYRKSLLMG